MGILDFIKKKEVFGDMRTHPNRVRLAEEILKKKNVIIELKLQSQQLAQNEIADWRKANQYALNYENPRRYQLYGIYYDAMLDDHLLGAIRNRKLKVMRTNFKLVDKNGKENPDITLLLKTKWFKKFMALSLDSIYWGHSLIEFGDIIRGESRMRFTDVKLVPRRHVIPEYHVIIKEANDEPKKGIDYLTPPFSDWCIPVGEPDDLGLLLPVAKETISKKYALQFWDQFAELFGMPIRIGKSSSRNKADLDKIESMLDDMGSAAWGLFPEGTEIEIKESSRGDSFNVYDKRIERANSEMSKAVLGQTMTMDDGSSKSQASVHAEVAAEIAEADADMLKDVVNDSLLPFLVKHGFPVQGYEFDWDLTYEYTPDEIQAIEDMLLGHFEIDPKYFVEKYNIPVTAQKQGLTLLKEKKKPLRLVSRPYFGQPDCACGDDSHLVTLADPKVKAETAGADLIRFIWDNRKAEYSIDYFTWLSDIYLDAIARGWRGNEGLTFAKPEVDPAQLDDLTRQMFELNIFRFSASKTAAAAIELNNLAKSADTFNDFRKEAEKVTRLYNEDYLRTEYNFAWNTSHNAAQYHRMVAVKDQYPTWQYMTAGDDRVRASHQALSGKKFKADDPAFDSIYPPNGWGCRCYVKALKGVPETYSTKADAEQALASSAVDSKGLSEWDRMVKGRFNKNRAKIRTIYDEDKFYLKETLEGKLSWKSQGLSEVDRSGKPKITISDRDVAFAETLLVDNKNLFTDYANRALKFSNKTLKSHSGNDRLNIIEFVPEILNSPDEVYLVEKGSSNSIQIKYIKHYDDRSLVIICDATDEGFNVKTWFEAEKDKLDNDWRTGILIKKASKH